MKASETGVITIKEDFMQVETRSLDSKSRVNLGNKVKKLLLKKMKVDSFTVFIGKDGDLLLRPEAHIPSRELWLYRNREAYTQVKEGLIQAKSGKVTKAKDLDAFLERL